MNVLSLMMQYCFKKKKEAVAELTIDSLLPKVKGCKWQFHLLAEQKWLNNVFFFLFGRKN